MVDYVGFDVSKTAFCVKDEAARFVARGKVATDPAALCAASIVFVCSVL